MLFIHVASLTQKYNAIPLCMTLHIFIRFMYIYIFLMLAT